MFDDLLPRSLALLERKGYPRWLSRLDDRLTDLRLGIRTGGVVETGIPDGCHASTIPYWAITAALKRLRLQPGDLFLDIGCGKGRVLAVAAREPIRLAMGIDANERMCNVAEENIRRLRGKRCDEWDVKQAYAEAFNYEQVSAAYCFNSFGSETLAKVLYKIRHDRKGLPFRMIFMNPSHTQIEVFRTAGWYRRYHGSINEMPYCYTECPHE
jgi:precorrin-6B methylase 2